MTEKRVFRPSDLRGPSVQDPNPKSAESIEARKLVRTFKQKDPSRDPYATGWSWPKSYKHIGTALSEAYSSDKWVQDYDFREFKHLAEGEHALYAAPSIWSRYKGPVVRPSDDGMKMPSYLAELSILIFIEARLFASEDRDGGVFGRGNDGHVRIEVEGALLYGGHATKYGRGAFSRDEKEPFLCIGTKRDGILYVITAGEDNSDFDILADGIVG